MKRILLILLILVFPAVTSAEESKPEPIKIYSEHYDTLHKKFNRKISDSHMFQLLDLLKLQLAKSKRMVIEVDKREEADYQVILIKPSPFYSTEPFDGKVRIPDLNPVFPKNKHAEDGNKQYKFTSPWIRGELYIKEEEPVGGNIIIQVSEIRRVKELYYISEQNWEAIPIGDKELLGELTISYDFVNTVYKEYIRTFSVLNIFKEGWKQPTKKNIEKVFYKKGENAIFLAHLLEISPLFDGSKDYKLKLEKCIKRSKKIYSHLYIVLFSRILWFTDYDAGLNHVNDITMPNFSIRNLHRNFENYNYNCFIPKSKNKGK